MTRRSMLLGLVVLALLTALVLPFFLRRTLRLYTDGARFRAEAGQAQKALREVLWEEAFALGPRLNQPGSDEYEPRVSPDGRFLAFTRGRPGGHADLWIATRQGAGWGQARPLEEVNSADDDMGAYFALLAGAPEQGGPLETLALLFYSNRPGGEGGYDLWASFEGSEGGWTAPRNLGPAVNTPFNEFSPSLDGGGRHLYFTSNRRGGQAPPPPHWLATLRETFEVLDYDVYRSEVSDLASLKLEPARGVEELNLAGYSEGAIAFSPQGDFLYFTSNRPGGLGGFDLYRARLLDGKLGGPENLGPQVNTRGHELDPALSSNGFELYFARQASGTSSEDIFVSVSREVFLQREAGDTYWSFAAVRAFLFQLLSRINPAVLALLASVLLCLIFALAFGRRMSRLALVGRCFVLALLVHLLLAIWMNSSKVQRALLSSLKTSDQPGAFEVSVESIAEEGVASSIRNQVAETGADAPPSFDVTSLQPAGGPDLVRSQLPLGVPPGELELRSTPFAREEATKTRLFSTAELEPAAAAIPREEAVTDPLSIAAIESLPVEEEDADPMLSLQARDLVAPPRRRVEPAVEFTDRQGFAPPAPLHARLGEVRPLPAERTGAEMEKPETARAERMLGGRPEKESLSMDPELEPGRLPEGSAGIFPVVELELARKLEPPEPGPSAAEPRLEPSADRGRDLPATARGWAVTGERVLTPMASGAARESRVTPGAATAALDRFDLEELSREEAKPRQGFLPAPGGEAPPAITVGARKSAPPPAEPREGRKAARTGLEPTAPREIPETADGMLKPSGALLAANRDPRSEGSRLPPDPNSALAAAPLKEAPEDSVETSSSLPDRRDERGAEPPELAVKVIEGVPPAASSPHGEMTSRFSARPELVREQAGLPSASSLRPGPPGPGPGASLTQASAPPPASGGLAAPAAGLNPELGAFPLEVVKARAVLPERREEPPEKLLEKPGAGPGGGSLAPVDGPAASAEATPMLMVGKLRPGVAPRSPDQAPVSFPTHPLSPTRVEGASAPPPGLLSGRGQTPPRPSADASGRRGDLGEWPSALPSRSPERQDPDPPSPLHEGRRGEKAEHAASRLELHGTQRGELALEISSPARELPPLPPPENPRAGFSSSAALVAGGDPSSSPAREAPPAKELVPPGRTNLAFSGAGIGTRPLLPSRKASLGETDLPAVDRGPTRAARRGSGGEAPEVVPEVVLTRKRWREPLPAPRLDARPPAMAATAVHLEESGFAGLLVRGPELPLEGPSALKGQAPLPSAATPLRSVPAASAFVPKIYRLRDKSRRLEAVRLGGGSPETEKAVALGLKWLALHQSPNGRWSLHDYARHLPSASERDLWHPDWDGTGQNDSRGGTSRAERGDTAGTALAILAFLGHGDTHVAEGPYREMVQRGLRYLVGRQQRDGDLRDGGNLYMHALATFALCEAYALTKDPQLEEPSRRAMGFTVRSQNPDLGGWRYEPYPQGRDVDTSVFGWMLMGIKSARLGNIEIDPKCVERMVRYLESARMTSVGGRFAYQPGLPRTSLAMTAQGLFCQQVLMDFLPPADERAQGRLRRAAGEAVSYMLRNLPVTRDQDGANSYYWYYATLAIFQEGGAAWEAWNKRMKEVILKLQLGEEEGTAGGSWDPLDRRAELGGRVYSTAVSILCLEVYYRYAPKDR